MDTTTQEHTSEFAGFRCRWAPRGRASRLGLPTRREAEVMAGLAAGLTQKEIAKARGVSPATVRSTATAAYYRLRAGRATDAVARALRRTWIAPLALLLAVSALNPHAEAMRHRPPQRVRQPVSASARLTRRDTGSLYA